MSKIAIIYTTFLRDELMKKTVRSIIDNWLDDSVLLIGDQNPTYQKSTELCVLASEVYPDKKIYYQAQPFDCGVSCSRNRLVKRAYELNIPYCLVTADSIAFTPQMVDSVRKTADFLDKDKRFDLVGYDLAGRVAWEFMMSLSPEAFELRPATEWHTDKDLDLDVLECDLCRQFFIARTESLLSVTWDPDLKTAEHEDFFWRYKQTGYKVCWTEEVQGQYIEDRPAEYWEYRKRCYGEFQELVKKKHGTLNWVRMIRYD